VPRSRVARCYILKPKKFGNIFEGRLNKKCWYMLWRFRIFYGYVFGNLVVIWSIVPSFWYVVQKKSGNPAAKQEVSIRLLTASETRVNPYVSEHRRHRCDVHLPTSKLPTAKMSTSKLPTAKMLTSKLPTAKMSTSKLSTHNK
jgi:hypothetical protein